jgi:predicted nucleic acid-binding protein
MIVVSDTSPISGLLKIGQIEILSKLFGEVVIPAAVERELLRAHSNFPKWLRVERVVNQIQATEFGKIVDLGEAEAIQLAKELRADRLLIDDLKGRKLAEREGVRAIGLVGVIIMAKMTGTTPSVSALLIRLKTEAHIYLSDEIVAAALDAVGESNESKK